MLTTFDVITGKMVVQLGFASGAEVRALLRAIDAEPARRHDILNRLTAQGRITQEQLELLRHRAALYEHVRREATYVRLLERGTTIQKETVARLLAELERSTFRRRLGDVLVRRGSLKAEYDRSLVERQERMLAREDEKILERYRAEDFAGVERPLIAGSRLEPHEFKISTLFRTKETRALVDKAELELLRKEAAREQRRAQEEDARRAAAQQAGVDDATLIMDGPAAGASDPALAETAKLAPGTVAAAQAEAAAEAAGERTTETSDGALRGSGRFLSAAELGKLQRLRDYAIVEVLGVGGMGAVFLAQKDGAGEYVAIKVLLDRAASDMELGRFDREIELTRRVRHPNVIAILDSGQTRSGLRFLVVPALAGKELRGLLEEAGGVGLPPALAIRVFEQCCEGLQAVHEQAIVHRDIKPENVFVLAGGRHEIKLMDFGLAKPSTEADGDFDVFMTQTGEVSGSPAYIAPETVTNDPIDARTDIYSLGVMLFEMLTGQLPLTSETAQGYLTQHLICPPLTLAEAAPTYRWPADLEELLASMLGKTRGERPASCAAILERLRGGLADEVRNVEMVMERTAILPAPEPAAEGGYGFKGLLGRLWAAR